MATKSKTPTATHTDRELAAALDEATKQLHEDLRTPPPAPLPANYLAELEAAEAEEGVTDDA